MVYYALGHESILPEHFHEGLAHTMVWLVRIMVVGIFAAYGPIIDGHNRQSTMWNVLVGLLTGLLLVWLSSVLGDRCKRVRAAHPMSAWRFGLTLYSICCVIAALCVGCAVSAGYTGASQKLIVVLASMSIIYWAAGWGLYRCLGPNADQVPVPRTNGVSLGQVISRSDWVSSVLKAPTATKRRQRKIVLSFAVVVALAAPFLFGTYKARPTYSVWVPLTAQEKENLSARYHGGSYCLENSSSVDRIVCRMLEEEYEQGGRYEYSPNLQKYLAINAGVATATFISVFVLAFLIPMLARGSAFIVRRYWQWLDA